MQNELDSFEPVHISVMLDEVLQSFAAFSTEEELFFLDGTAGEGGHSEAILHKFPNSQILLLDRDSQMLQRAKERLYTYQNRIYSMCNNFSDFSLDTLQVSSFARGFDAIVLDLGISTFHYDGSGRGFSYAKEEPLDMRLDGVGISAKDVIARYPEKKLLDLFWKYGEERWSKKIAAVLVEKRKKVKIQTCKELADLVAAIIPRKFWPPKSHPATRIFQALRIEVNRELYHIEHGLPQLFSMLKPGGIFTVISFHSLEDRIVKNVFRDWKQQKSASLLYKKPLAPSEEEVRQNRAARSAKLRAIRKLGLDRTPI
ncbi:MAG: 16S rRNA (cytosine(1402)-N(4))-methyltransferase RsmH [Spirochaetota bacterium]